MGFREKLGFRRKIPVEKPKPKPERRGCKFRYKKKSDGYEVEFSPECKPEERIEIMRNFKGKVEEE